MIGRKRKDAALDAALVERARAPYGLGRQNADLTNRPMRLSERTRVRGSRTSRRRVVRVWEPVE